MSEEKQETFGEARTGIREEEDFGALFEASEAAAQAADGVSLEPGEIVKGTIVSISKDTAFVDLGGKTEGQIQLEELAGEDGTATVAVGDVVEAYVVGLRDGVQLSSSIAKGARALEELQTAFDAQIPIEGNITGVNKGGVEVDIAGTRAFCPVSQLDLNFVEDTSAFVGQTHRFVITKLSGSGKRMDIVLSRRVLLQQEKEEKAKETRKHVVEGAILKGRVRNIRDFGVFVDLGGIDGLVHVSELSWERVSNPAEVVKMGDELTVKVLKTDWDANRISLSVKAALPDPWITAEQTFAPGNICSGKVVRLADYGAFVELGPGLDGLVHISELSWKRVSRANEAVQVGDTIDVKVLDVDLERRRISLSLKQAHGEDPWTTAASKYPSGTNVDCTVEKVERFGIFVTVEEGLTALIPASESATERGSDLFRQFPKGKTLTAQVLSVSAGERRMSLSLRALSDDRDDQEVVQYQRRQRAAQRESSGGGGGGGGGFGTFGDLLKGKLDKLNK